MLNIKKILPSKEKLPLIAKFFTVILVLILLGLIAYKYKGAFIIATINGKPITRFELIKELEKNYAKATLENIISQKLIEEEANKSKVTVSDEEIANEFKKIEDSLKPQNLSLDEALAMQGITREELTKQMILEKKIEKMLEPKIIINESEISDYVKNNAGITAELAREEILKQKISVEFYSFLQELHSKANIKLLTR